MVAVVLAGLAIVPLVGGSIARLGQIELARSWMIFAGLGLQLIVTTIFPNLPSGPSQVVHMVSYVFILGFMASNHRQPGVKVLTLGTLLNFTAIVANRGTMPARPGAMRTAGIKLTHAFENSAPVRHARLGFLGDVFAVPASWPLANVFSVGDVLIDVGALILIITTCRREPEAVAAEAAATPAPAETT